jgi:hypothetical protein
MKICFVIILLSFWLIILFIFYFFKFSIKLGKDVLHLDETIQPICVACLDNQTFPQGQAYIAGWGNIDRLCNNLK